MLPERRNPFDKQASSSSGFDNPLAEFELSSTKTTESVPTHPAASIDQVLYVLKTLFSRIESTFDYPGG